MSNYGGSSYGGDGREPGARRRKFAGYLKAANELRQSYTANYTAGWGDRGTDWQDGDDGPPGAFPDSSVSRSGEGELVLFPSYARKHVKTKPKPKPATNPVPAAGTAAAPTADADPWHQQWDEYEDDHAVVDVDIRGWIFTPHTGPMNRKQRLWMGLARQLVGIQASRATVDESSSPDRGSMRREGAPHGLREMAHAHAARQEEEFVAKQAESMIKKGEAEAKVAGEGGYSEAPKADADNLSVYSDRSGASSPGPDALRPHNLRKIRSGESIRSDDSMLTAVQRREALSLPANMSPAELATANRHLTTRLKPFLAFPQGSTPITAFFYNDESSRQRTIYTNNAGHFNLRAALDFVPTHVRVLASEKLSLTEEVLITPTRGVSLISDIDDTIKHTAISSGAREIFRNAFIRELDDLTIDGVQNWYNDLADMGVKFHYVSNSPWQLFPLLKEFFVSAGLPDGSFHLKQYSGMLQGIFEPVAERKKGTLERISRDFPDRKFILVGDSGEADLEVYTDFVLDNPGRVLGVFIRDVTTPEEKGFFDSAMAPPLAAQRDHKLQGQLPDGATKDYGANSTSAVNVPNAADEENDPQFKAAIEASLRDMEEHERRLSSEANETPPSLPPRRKSDTQAWQQMEAPRQGPAVGQLIDIDGDDVPPPKLKRLNTEPSSPAGPQEGPKSRAPPPPRKPVALRSGTATPSASTSTISTTASSAPTNGDQSQPQPRSKPAPPPPRSRKPSTPSHSSSTTTLSPTTATAPTPPRRSSTLPLDSAPSTSNSTNEPTATNSQLSYTASARQRLSAAYNALPAAPSSYWPSRLANTNGASTSRGPAPPPPRRPQHPSTQTSQTPSRDKDAPAPSEIGHLPHAATMPSATSATTTSTAAEMDAAQAALNRKVDLWKRRWEKAEEVMRSKGVVLSSWRVGEDVQRECGELVRRALREMEE